MSGLEVAGLVLGALPVAITALRYYKDLLAIREAQRRLSALIRDLETEKILLRQTCERLLQGIIPDADLDRLALTPFASEWGQYNDKLRLRLWTGWANFQEQLTEMSDATKELHRMLKIPQDGKLEDIIPDKASLLRQLKEIASFTLNKDDYKDLMTRIKGCNSVLKHLSDSGSGGDAGRQCRSRWRAVRLIRSLSRKMFKAIGNSSSCCCQNPHKLCLELENRGTTTLPEDLESDDEVFKNIHFHVVFGLNGDAFQAALTKTGYMPAADWQSFHIRIPPSSENRLLASTPTSPPSRNRLKKEKRRVQWPSKSTINSSSGASATQSLVSSVSSTVVVPTSALDTESRTISRLCQTISRQKSPATPCYGYIQEETCKFGLYQPSHVPEFSQAVSIRQILKDHEDRGTRTMQFNYADRLRAALAISSGILQLFSTPWLPKKLSLDDFIFIHVRGDTVKDQDAASYLCRPFIAKNVLESSSDRPSTVRGISRPINTAVLSLGALLIQIMIGKVDQELDCGDVGDLGSALAKREAGIRLSGETLTEGGENYAEAVSWCLRCVLRNSGLGDEKFCTEFYANVVERLEEDVRAYEAVAYQDDY